MTAERTIYVLPVSLNSSIKGRQPQQKRSKRKHLKPVVVVRFNTQLGRAKPVTCTALVDSGGAESIATEKLVTKLRVRKTTGPPQKWGTCSGELTTNKKAKSQFTLPELHNDKLIEWDFHVTPDLGVYDLIIGCDLMEFLGIDVCFSTQEVEWDNATVPFKDGEEALKGLFHVDDPEIILEEHERVKKILNAKYEAADLEQVCREQTLLSNEEQQKLLQLLQKYTHGIPGHRLSLSSNAQDDVVSACATYLVRTKLWARK